MHKQVPGAGLPDREKGQRAGLLPGCCAGSVGRLRAVVRAISFRACSAEVGFLLALANCNTETIVLRSSNQCVFVPVRQTHQIVCQDPANMSHHSVLNLQDPNWTLTTLSRDQCCQYRRVHGKAALTCTPLLTWLGRDSPDGVAGMEAQSVAGRPVAVSSCNASARF